MSHEKPVDPLEALRQLREKVEAKKHERLPSRSFESNGYTVTVELKKDDTRVVTMYKGGQTSTFKIDQNDSFEFNSLIGLENEDMRTESPAMARQHYDEFTSLLQSGQLEIVTSSDEEEF
ncbi:MAG: hypothetical protein KC877_05285 [Candidatus Kaiserbacteria bacterium]|nr:hypothetical protein [Candidatus Kaiserbacteria bacterium]MCB9816092.1 hypothetical protein [Candidatus Nomurabacteria bacterium]